MLTIFLKRTRDNINKNWRVKTKRVLVGAVAVMMLAGCGIKGMELANKSVVSANSDVFLPVVKKEEENKSVKAVDKQKTEKVPVPIVEVALHLKTMPKDLFEVRLKDEYAKFDKKGRPLRYTWKHYLTKILNGDWIWLFDEDFADAIEKEMRQRFEVERDLNDLKNPYWLKKRIEKAELTAQKDLIAFQIKDSEFIINRPQIYSAEKREETAKTLTELKPKLLDTENKLKKYEDIITLPYDKTGTIGNVNFDLVEREYETVYAAYLKSVQEFVEKQSV